MTAAMTDLTPALPEVFLFAAGLVLLFLGVFRERDGLTVVNPLVVLSLLVAAVLTIGIDKGPVVAFDGHFVFDGFAAFLKVLIYVTAALGVLMAPPYLADARMNRFEFPVLALFATLGMGMMVSANSLLALYMGLELQSLSLYVMAAFQRDSMRASEAGLKYFVLGALASGMLLYGASLVYGFTGTLSFDALARSFLVGEGAAALPAGAVVGLVFVVAALAFKLSAVPFHMWTPDVYEGAPTPVTAFLAAAPKVAAVGLLLRLLFQPFGDWAAQWQQVVVLVSVASMVLGAFAAIGQTNIKRLMAYSAIGHVGYALVGVAAGGVAGVNAVLVYMAIYVVMTLGTFACILLMRRHGRYVEGIADLAGLSRHQPGMALMLGILMFSLAGIPPAAGFFGKLYVFLAAVEAGLVWLALVGVLTSVVGAYYYLRIVKIMYFDEPAEAFDTMARPELQGVAAVAAVLVAGFLLLPGPLLSSADAAARALLP
ncbi:MAG TPA: NADH-quinone oxidoreductase subunit NuoN [Rhodospirillales bacterium]|nr:NADH-quinone oxidoreductase subunit NuoN [Rhodospirillales bacterium]